MSKKFRDYLYKHYATNGEKLLRSVKKDPPIQIDDQDDNDMLTEFCNIFVTVGSENNMEIDISGNFPITSQLADYSEIYGGTADTVKKRLTLSLYPEQADALIDLAGYIRKTADMGNAVGNPSWNRISARTISSLKRFLRVVREYRELRSSGLL